MGTTTTLLQLVPTGTPGWRGGSTTDNGWAETGYRWHDALHLAHAVCLGWSPILRGPAKLKRRSDPRVDHVEDGGRAAVADEAIAWAVFCHARQRDWFEGGQPIDGNLIDSVHAMTYGLEVAQRSRDEIEHAIRSGVRRMRALWWHNGGILRGDLRTQTLTWHPATETTAPSAPSEALIWAETDNRSVPPYAGTPA